jgi:hypothetical protein
VDRASLCGILRHSNVTHAEPLLAASAAGACGLHHPIQRDFQVFNYIMLLLVGKPKLNRLL